MHLGSFLLQFPVLDEGLNLLWGFIDLGFVHMKQLIEGFSAQVPLKVQMLELPLLKFEYKGMLVCVFVLVKRCFVLSFIYVHFCHSYFMQLGLKIMSLWEKELIVCAEPNLELI